MELGRRDVDGVVEEGGRGWLGDVGWWRMRYGFWLKNVVVGLCMT